MFANLKQGIRKAGKVAGKIGLMPMGVSVMKKPKTGKAFAGKGTRARLNTAAEKMMFGTRSRN